MKIVHICQYDTNGGAAIAALRHCQAMREAGVDASMLVAKKMSSFDYVFSYDDFFKIEVNLVYRLKYHIWLTIKKLLNPIGTFTYGLFDNNYSLSSVVQQADIIFLHWVSDNMMSVKNISQILQLGKPTYWYMHDMEPITGGCHHSLQCSSYKDKCKQCQLCRGYAIFKFIISRRLRQKVEQWSRFNNLHFVTPSRWLAICVQESVVGIGHDVKCVPNVIDTDVFMPFIKKNKALFGLDPNKYTILFCAANYDSPYKGACYMHDFLMQLDANKYEALSMGHLTKGFVKDIPINIISTGYIDEDVDMVKAYNACDIFVITSVAENYPNVIMEAMACGIPCVGFPSGGVPELILHEQTGYLTTRFDSKQVVEGVNWILADADRYKMLSNNARDMIFTHNSFKNVLSIHKEIQWDNK